MVVWALRRDRRGVKFSRSWAGVVVRQEEVGGRFDVGGERSGVRNAELERNLAGGLGAVLGGVTSADGRE